MKYKIAVCFVCLICFTPLISFAQITTIASADTVGTYQVLELTIHHPETYTNNWEDVRVNVTFSGPKTIPVNGFFYDTYTWKVRFAPPDTGHWSYVLNFITPQGSYSDTGKFICTSSTQKGFLKRHPNNVNRLIYADGTLFNGMGFEDCVLDFNGDGTPLDDFGFDGGFYPPNALGSRTDLNTYMTAYGTSGAGFNLFRWTTNNCSFQLYDSITTVENTYLAKQGMFGDSLVRSLQKNKIRIWLTFFGPPLFSEINGSQPLEDQAIERYISYVVARYGAYVDIWELFNESAASDYYYKTITAYIRSIDPYHRLISVSDERPALSCIDINSPHWYQKESEYDSDLDAYNMITSRKQYQKPVIFGEQGNSIQNWDPLSAERMRLRAWTSFFAEGILIFWNTSNVKNYTQTVAANIYLGPQERSYIRSLQNFTVFADSTVSQVPIAPFNPGDVRAYGLEGDTCILAYFHHYSSHASTISTHFSFRLRKSATVYWVNPANDSLLYTARLPFGAQTITTPEFYIDLAMRIKLDSVNAPFDETKKLDLIIYPNPASSMLSVSGNFNGLAQIAIYTLSGKKIFIKNQITNDEPFNVSSLKQGVYIYNVMADTRQIAGKLIIKK